MDNEKIDASLAAAPAAAAERDDMMLPVPGVCNENTRRHEPPEACVISAGSTLPRLPGRPGPEQAVDEGCSGA
jgi:hypothetical protein